MYLLDVIGIVSFLKFKLDKFSATLFREWREAGADFFGTANQKVARGSVLFSQSGGHLGLTRVMNNAVALEKLDLSG